MPKVLPSKQVSLLRALAEQELLLNFLNIVLLFMQVDVGNFLRFKSCVLYTELEDPSRPMINVEVVAHVMRPELRTSQVSTQIQTCKN